MHLRSFCFYVCEWPTGDDVTEMALPLEGGYVYVRATAHDGGLEAALSEAAPRPGERVMNSHAFLVRDLEAGA